MRIRTSKNKYMTRKQRRELFSKGIDLCSFCKKLKPLIEFRKNSHTCKECRKTLVSNWANKNPNYMTEYRIKNKKQRSDYNKKWYESNKDHSREIKRKWRAFKQKTDPVYRLLNRLRGVVRSLKNKETSNRTLSYIQVVSIEDFITKMTEKTTNKSWLSSKWHIDHIWQLNWFSDSLKTPNDEMIRAISRHQNLRPLSPTENISRSRFDFSPLLKEDFSIYEPYLNADVKEKIKIHFGIV